MSKAPAFQFYVRDWLSDPQLKMASHFSKGVWIDLLCYMWESPSRGELAGSEDNFCRMLGLTCTEFSTFIKEAETLNFASVTKSNNGGNAEVTIRNRRMVRDEKERKNNALRQTRFKSNAKSNGKVTVEVTPPSSSSPSLKDSLAKANVLEVPSSNDHCPHQEIIKLYRKYLPMCPEIVKWTDTRASHLRARWNENEDQRSLEWWEALFQQIAQSKFLTGRVTGRGGKPFFASLEWIVKPENFAKILEGRYHE